jgi:hypothetical protein
VLCSKFTKFWRKVLPPSSGKKTKLSRYFVRRLRINYVKVLSGFRTIRIDRGHAVAQLVEALRYKSEGRGFDSLWCHWNYSLT